MNPATEPPRSSISCDRHPDENFTGFCQSCLCERLTALDQSANAANAIASSSSRRNSTSSSTAAAAIRSIFRVPELRRTKSFSASKHEGLGLSAGVYEPQRKSCDVRGRNSLSSLFSIHDENINNNKQALGSNGVVLETNREEEEEGHQFQEHEDDDEIKVTEEPDPEIVNDIDDDLMLMKDHIDLESQSKKPSRSNFWSTASALSKKWHKWRRKQKNHVAGVNDVSLPSTLPVEKTISRQFRETQSEIADYGYGRRSCDTDPRFSLDVGRISFDDPRYSFDEPRVSWDGYLIGRTFPRLPPMVEDAAAAVHVVRCDSQIPVEEVAELDETKVSNPKPSPATIDLNPANIAPIDPPRVSYSNSSETFELGFRDRDNGVPIAGDKKEPKKSRKWLWKIWGLGFIHRRNKDDDDEDVGRCYSESWQDCRNEVNNNINNNDNNGINPKVFRSNSSVSWRSSSLRKSNPNNNMNRKNRRTGDEYVLERNRSARYSPNHIDNGLLRFYLGPLSGSRRSGIGLSTAKARPASNTHSITRSMLELY